MKTLRILIGLSAALSMVLGACQPASPTAPPSGATAAPPQATTVSQEATTAPAAEEIVITFWHQEQVDRRIKILQKLLDEFYAESGIKVVQETMTWDEQYVRLMSAIQAGTPPDITWGGEDVTLTLHTAGAIQPVTDIVQELDGLYQFVPIHRDKMFYQSEYWAVPVFALSYNFWYRKDLFSAAGLKPPETWDDVVAAAKALNDPANQRWGISLPTGETMYGEQVADSLMLGCGGNIMEKGNKLAVNSPETMKALDYYRELAKYTPPDSGNYTWPEAGIAFAQGKTAMLITFNAVLDYASVAENKPENLGIVKMPHCQGADAKTVSYTLDLNVITKDPVKREAVHKWLLFMFDPKNYGEWAAEFEPGLFLPITKAGLDSESYWAHPMVAPYKDQVHTAMELTSINTNMLWAPGDTPDENAGVITAGRPLMTAVQALLFNGATPAEGAAIAEQIIKDNLGW